MNNYRGDLSDISTKTATLLKTLQCLPPMYPRMISMPGVHTYGIMEPMRLFVKPYARPTFQYICLFTPEFMYFPHL